MEPFWRWVAEDRKFIWAARKGVAALVVIVVAVTWIGVDQLYSERMRIQSERIAQKDDVIVEIQRQLGGVPPDQLARAIEALRTELKKLKEPYWPPLSAAQSASLQEKLKSITPRPVLILCSSIECRDLGSSFKAVFTAANWQDVGFDASLDVIGIEGIRIESDDVDAQALEAAIETATGLPVRTLTGAEIASERFVLLIGDRPLGSE